MDWAKPLKTKTGKKAELIQAGYVWEKDLVVNLVKIDGGDDDEHMSVLIPSDPITGAYVKARPGDWSMDLENNEEPDTPVVEKGIMLVVFISVDGRPVSLTEAHMPHLPEYIRDQAVSVKVPIVKMGMAQYESMMKDMFQKLCGVGNGSDEDEDGSEI